MTTAIGNDVGLERGVATCRPSIAISTLIAGVIHPLAVQHRCAEHAKRHEQRRRQAVRSCARQERGEREDATFPWLSARITTAMYLIEMTITGCVQDEREHAKHVCASAEIRGSRRNIRGSCYSGLVPMSRNNTIAVSVSGNSPGTRPCRSGCAHEAVKTHRG